MKAVKKAVAFLCLLLILPLRPSSAQEEEPGNRFTVLTFNVWGIVGAKERNARMEAIGKELARLNPDIIALEEAFEAKHRKILLESLKQNGYGPFQHYYFKNAYGSGLLFITRFPVKVAEFEPYRVIGGPWDIEWLGGKGIAHFILETRWGPLDFFHTHAIARMTPAFDEQGNYIPGDPKQTDRLLHMFQIDRFIRLRKSAGARAVIAAGDFNVSPEMLEYQFLVALTGFENSFDVLHPGENPSTYSTADMWAEGEYSRIDHIFFKNYPGGSGFWVRPVESRLVMNQGFQDPESGKRFDYSDHYGLLTLFEVENDEHAVSFSPEGAGAIPAEVCPCASCPLSGFENSVLTLTIENREQWLARILDFYEHAFQKQNREDQLLIPLAEAVVKSGKCPARVEIPEELRPRFEKEVCGAPCGFPPRARKSRKK